METFTFRELFGGAITTLIPENFADISDVREVPDNQEVYANADTDQSIIIEILQYVHSGSDEDAVRHHFMSVASDNDAEEYSSIQAIVQLTAQDIPKLPPETPKYLLSGQQSVSKFHESDPNSRNLVNIFLALIRLPSY
ncbi:16529_t:CDS:2, partial [Acaulospora morrowiae]